MPIDVKNLPHDGYSERENSDAINQIIQFGSAGANVYGGDGSGQSFTVPAGHFEGTGPFRVNDPNVKPGSLVIIDPTNIAGIIASVGVETVGDGFFEVNDPPPQLMFAAAQVFQADGLLLGGLFGGVVIPFDTQLFSENWTVSTAQNRITSLIIGLIEMSITVSGSYDSGQDYEFGVSHFNSADALQGSFTLKASTSNQNDVISVGGSAMIDNVLEGDYFVPLGIATSVAVFDYDMTLGLKTISPTRGVIVTGEVTYNYVVIQ